MLGGIGAGGLVVQIILGFALAHTGDPKGSALIYPHVLIGVAGLALVAFLAVNIFRTPSLMTVRFVYVLALVFTLAQVALGFLLLGSPGAGVLMAHQGIALLILVLMAAAGALSARSRRTPPAP